MLYYVHDELILHSQRIRQYKRKPLSEDEKIPHNEFYKFTKNSNPRRLEKHQIQMVTNPSFSVLARIRKPGE